MKPLGQRNPAYPKRSNKKQLKIEENQRQAKKEEKPLNGKYDERNDYQKKPNYEE